MDVKEFSQHVNHRPINEVKHLFHGSKSGIRGRIVPDFRMARHHVDFGRGFYLGDNATQAKTLICGRDDYTPVFYKADIDLRGLRCVRISDTPWALFVAYNRGLLDEMRGTMLYRQISEIGDKQDIIIGPIADDRTVVVLNEYFDGNITDTTLAACMRGLNPGTQYVAKTQAACDHIEITDTYHLQPNEIKAMRIKGTQSRTDGTELVKPIKARYRRLPGTYFDELLEKEREQLVTDHRTTPNL